MPKYSKKFVVFENDWEIYLYNPDTDDRFLKEQRAIKFDSLKEAKQYATLMCNKRWKEELDKIDNFKYKDFK